MLVLGERHGDRRELRQAWAVVQTLAERGPVTVALEAVHEDNQTVLFDYAGGTVKRRTLPDTLRWDETWGFRWRPYRRLVTAHDIGATVVAAGTTLGPMPDDRDVPVPEDYASHLMAYMGSHGHGEMPAEMVERFTRSMTWRDFRLGELAAAGWDQQGVLVVVVGRGHVEGGLGTNWQLERLVDVPVYSAVLSDEDARCYPGDRVLEQARLTRAGRPPARADRAP